MGKKKDSLGRALIKDRFTKNRHKKHVENNTLLHTTEVNDGYDWGRLNLQSVTNQTPLEEFLSTAELAHRDFTAEKLNLKYVVMTPDEVQTQTSQPNFDEPLTVPRRPLWHPSLSAEEQLDRERTSFLEWRRNLNDLQNKLGAALTPYERNLELWKQLWRTLEKSDVVLVLLDARNPLLFRCADLEKYASEQKCKCILLLNKADLTSEYERKCWAKYFNEQNVPIIFFSAAKNSKERKISEEIVEETEYNDSDGESELSESEVNNKLDNIEENDDDELNVELFQKQLDEVIKSVKNSEASLNRIDQVLEKVNNYFKKGIPVKQSECLAILYPENIDNGNSNVDEAVNETDTSETKDSDEISKSNEVEYSENEDETEINNSHEVYDRDMLLELLKKKKTHNLKNPPRLTVGLIGYPNVGKSSSVNILMQTKKVSVSSMPGHTRHIQTLVLDEDVMLLDCPGLVLPAYAVAPDLLLTAVLPIDQMHSHDAAMARLCQLVSRHTFEQKYGLLLPDNESGDTDYKQILTAHAFNRGFMTAAGQPDQSRSARLLLKDAASGRLHWEQLPPGFEPAPIEEMVEQQRRGNRKPTPREARLVEGWQNKAAEIDRSFFAMKSTAHVKGKTMMDLTGAQSASNQTGKPWKHEKKHANKNKREKLRRVYAHLDEW